MGETVDFTSCHIDPAPLQIMEGTPLSNVICCEHRRNQSFFNSQCPIFSFLSGDYAAQIHNLFSLLSLQVVYVTSLGRLTGVVSLKDLRRVIENVEKGNVPCRPSKPLPGMDVVTEEEEEQPLQSDSTDV